MTLGELKTALETILDKDELPVYFLVGATSSEEGEELEVAPIGAVDLSFGPNMVEQAVLLVNNAD